MVKGRHKILPSKFSMTHSLLSIILPDELHLRSDHLIRLLKPIYDLLDTGDYCYGTLLSHLRPDFRLEESSDDLYLLNKSVLESLLAFFMAKWIKLSQQNKNNSKKSCTSLQITSNQSPAETKTSHSR